MPIQITPDRSSEILLSAFDARDKQKENELRNQMLQLQMQKLQSEALAGKQRGEFYQGLEAPSAPAQQSQAGLEAFNQVPDLQQFGIQTDPSLLKDIDRTPASSLSDEAKMKAKIQFEMQRGNFEGAKQLQDIWEKQKDDNEANFSLQLYKQHGANWKEEAKRLAPDRADDIDRTEINDFYMKYTDKDGTWYRSLKDGKETFQKTSDDKKTNDIKEYEFAVEQGYKGTFPDWQMKMKKAGAATTNIDLGKPVITKLQEGVIDAQTQIDAFQLMKDTFKPEYLTYKTKAEVMAANVGDKFGVPSSDFINMRQQWYQASKAQFLAYRKWVTGVAGGEKEMAEIAKSFPDPDKNSPSQYQNNLIQAEKTARRLQQRYNMFLVNGIKPTKQQLSAIPLDSVVLPEETTGGIKGVSAEVEDYFKKHPIKGK